MQTSTSTEASGRGSLALAQGARSLALIAASLPESHAPFTDKYFLRTGEILRSESLNPWVRAQIVIRQGPGTLGGIDEALAVIARYSPLTDHGGRIFAREDGAHYDSNEAIIVLEGPIQDFVELETMYLGVLSAGTTKATDEVDCIDFEKARERMARVARHVPGRDIIYMGARHWHFRDDAAISRAAFDGGAAHASTDAGAETAGKAGVGTIPHVLENIMAWRYGKDRAVVEATRAFHRVIDPQVPRVALIDYANRELRDTLTTAMELGRSLSAIRVDTCGENIAEGALLSPESIGAHALRAKGIDLPGSDHPDSRFWYGNGVTVSGVYALRKALNEAGREDVKIILSSGFGSEAKVKAFVEAETRLSMKLFDVLGVGGIFDSRAAKMDIVAAGDGPESMIPVSKAGRSYRPNAKLVEVTARIREARALLGQQ